MTFIQPGTTAAIATGLSFSIPRGYELQIRARSGVSLTTKLRIAPGIGTVDENFKGEVKIIVDNIGSEVIRLEIGQRIAQAALREVPTVNFVEDMSNATAIEDVGRGTKGFGSSGT